MSLTHILSYIFQTCEPAILPPLSEIYPGNMAADLFGIMFIYILKTVFVYIKKYAVIVYETGVRAIAEKNIEDICGVNINRIKSDSTRIINRSSLADLFISFLAKVSYLLTWKNKRVG